MCFRDSKGEKKEVQTKTRVRLSERYKKRLYYYCSSFTARSLKRLTRAPLSSYSPPQLVAEGGGEGEWCRQLRSYGAKSHGLLWGGGIADFRSARNYKSTCSFKVAGSWLSLYVHSGRVCMVGLPVIKDDHSFVCLFFFLVPCVSYTGNHFIREIRKGRGLGVISCRFLIPLAQPAMMWMAVASTSLAAVKVIFGCEVGRGKPY